MNKTLKGFIRTNYGTPVVDNVKVIEKELGTCTTVDIKTTQEGKLELLGTFGEDKQLKKVAEMIGGKFV